MMDERQRQDRRDRRPRLAAPLDLAELERVAIGYVGRYATSRARLVAYLARKLASRGWAGDGAPPLDAIAERMAAAGYVDDRGFAAARAAGLTRRGYGRRRVAAALYAAGIDDADRAPALAVADAGAWDAALAFARRRRIGPYAAEAADRDAARKAIAALLRAGHGLEIARAIVAAPPGEAPAAPET